jgi:hypothetical protein
MAVTAGLGLVSGCSDASLALALEAQQRANAVQQAVFDRQHDGLRTLLFRDVVNRLAVEEPISPEQAAVLNEAWNERDLIEFWAIQHERAKALRLVGVDSKLYADQSPVDLLIKAAEDRVDRGVAALTTTLATDAGEEVAGE